MNALFKYFQDMTISKCLSVLVSQKISDLFSVFFFFLIKGIVCLLHCLYYQKVLKFHVLIEISC